jgi:hypothetical protein
VEGEEIDRREWRREKREHLTDYNFTTDLLNVIRSIKPKNKKIKNTPIMGHKGKCKAKISWQ